MQNIADLHTSTEFQESVKISIQDYKHIQMLPTFISQHYESATHSTQHSFMTSADLHLLQGKQFEAYNLVKQHAEATSPTP